MTRPRPDTRFRSFPRPFSEPGALRGRRLRGIALFLLLALAGFALGCPVDEDPDDQDGDGIVDAEDACPRTTPLGAPLFQGGCALTDFILEPESLTDPLNEQIDELSMLPFSDEPMLDEASIGLQTAAMHFELARDAFRRIEPCESAAELQQAQDALMLGSDAFNVFLGTLVRISQGTPKPDDDVDELSSEYLWWFSKQAEYDSLLGQTAMAGETANEVCQAIVGSETVQGDVDATNPSKRTFHLEGGPVVVMAPTMLYENSITPGVQVSADVVRFFDDTLITNGGTISWKTVVDLPGIWDGLCMQLRVMPWGINQPGMGHDMRGYLDTQNRLQLEYGMALGAYGPLCPVKSETEPYTKYGYRLTLLQNNGFQQIPLASSIVHGQHASLPSYISPAVATDLKIEKLRWFCEKDPLSILGKHKCGQETVVDTTTYPIQIHPKFDFCEAIYNKTRFTLPNSNSLAYEEAMVLGVNKPASLGPIAFHAEARKIVNGGPGAIQPIGIYQPFAVFRSDAGLAPHGTNRSSAIRWPHIVGFRNNLPYRYACSVPQLVRDRLNYCPGVPDTYYRMPYQNAVSTYVGQGNNTPWSGDPNEAPSHWPGSWQRYALDLGNPIGTNLVATREGVVKQMVTNLTIRCVPDPNGPGSITVPGGQPCPNPQGFFGNYVAIEHADGDWSWYMHMDPYSASGAGLYIGKFVKRGQKIGEVGLTGNTTGPHVHYHVTPGSQGSTSWETYQFYTDSSLSNLATCQVPGAGTTVWSNNLP